MEKFFSKTIPELLTHIIFRETDFNGRLNLVEPKEFLQVAALLLQDEEEFKPHVHVWKNIDLFTSVAQEAWVVIEGKISVQLLDPSSNLVGETILNLGDCCITLNGGHKYRSIGRSKVFEFKSGPYLGDELDKVYVSEM
jgi:hypothetical protein